MKHPPASGSPSPEMIRLLACVRPVPRPFSPPASPIDWPRLLDLATHHHVLPLAYRSLKAAAREGESVPVELLAYLQRQQRAIAAHNVRATAILRRLQRQAESAGIRLVPIKGPALAALAYGSTSLRQFEDLDLLVRQEDLLRAVELLEREGYALRELPPRADRARYASWLQDWSLQKPGEALHLDLKPVLISHTLCRPSSADWMETSCRNLPTGEGESLLAPGPEAMLLAVCVDGANELWPKLSSVADAAALLSRFPDADWAGLVKAAAHLGHRRSVLVGAQVAHLLLECPLPVAIREAAGRDRASRRLAEEAAARMAAGVSLSTGILRQCAFAFRTREDWRDRVRFLGRLLFVPGAADLHQMALPGPWHPLYSCTRPFRLAWDAFRGRSRRVARAGASSNP
jgi:hypothetical protein